MSVRTASRSQQQLRGRQRRATSPIPFDARMIGPAVVDGVCGLIFYFAALLVGMRDAKWYGTRLLGFGSACLCFAEVTRTGLLSHALEWCAAGLAVVVIAAWGAFIAGGRYASQPLVAKIATAFSIAAAWECRLRVRSRRHRQGDPEQDRRPAAERLQGPGRSWATDHSFRSSGIPQPRRRRWTA